MLAARSHYDQCGPGRGSHDVLASHLRHHYARHQRPGHQNEPHAGGHLHAFCRMFRHRQRQHCRVSPEMTVVSCDRTPTDRLADGQRTEFIDIRTPQTPPHHAQTRNYRSVPFHPRCNSHNFTETRGSQPKLTGSRYEKTVSCRGVRRTRREHGRNKDECDQVGLTDVRSPARCLKTLMELRFYVP